MKYELFIKANVTAEGANGLLVPKNQSMESTYVFDSLEEVNEGRDMVFDQIDSLLNKSEDVLLGIVIESSECTKREITDTTHDIEGWYIYEGVKYTTVYHGEIKEVE